MNEELLQQLHNWGVTAKEWAQFAFWLASGVMCLAAAYRFLFA